ncbi:DUF6114 domain-containing protein [Embleya scabrispora]|uniref:DUF6114 domain-containing protein n=1 Tax=Embleya scabrispora TaxID=159449 RepID=UPI001F3BB2A7|nr:DUF6114 domain-containing protein [Embleya scabrispora]
MTPAAPAPRRPLDRPVLAAVAMTAAAIELAYLPLRRPRLLGLQGVGATSSVLIACGLLACAALALWRPGRARAAGAGALVLGLLSCPMSNLGGFLIGMLLAVLGGSLALAWRETPRHTPEERHASAEPAP